MPRLATLLIAPAATCAALLAFAPASHGGVATIDASGTLIYTALPGETNRLGVQASGAGSGWIALYDAASGISGPTPPGCTRPEYGGENAIDCPAPVAVRGELGDGDDEGYVSSDVTTPVAFYGGEGNDGLSGNDAPQTLDGGPGNDKLEGSRGDDLLIGGDGEDELQGGAGHDQLDGGAGNDLLSGDGYEGQYTDVIDGGSGVDSITADWGNRFQPSAQQPPISLTLGGGADDGRPGEGDDVRGIERVAVNIAGSYAGSDAAEAIEVRQVLGPVRIDGGGGDDLIKAADGSDAIFGGAGNDTIDGGFGDDTITPGPGRDEVSADTRGGDCGPAWCKVPYGNDTIDAVDGELDSIACGAGDDRVAADPQDVVAADCERVERVRGVTPVTGSPQTGNGTAAGVQVSIAKVRLPRALSTGLRVRVTGLTPRRKVTLTAKLAGRSVATGRARASASGAATVRLRFTKAGKRTVRGRAKVTLRISGRGVPTQRVTLGSKA